MPYTVRTAKHEDLPTILHIYAGAREFMARTGNPNQWGKTNPPESQLILDIDRGVLFVLVDGGVIHGVFYFAVEEDPTYANIHEGSWDCSTAYGVIHRIASDGSGGIFTGALNYAKTKADHIRIDTHHDNRVMQHVVEKHGFKKQGIIYIADGTPRIAYALY